MSVVRRHNARTWCAMAFFGLALAGGTWLAAISQQPGSANAPGAAASNSKYVVASAPDNYDEIVASARNSWPIDLATVGCLSVSERSSIFHKNYYDDHRIVTILQEQFPGKSVNRKNDACRFALDFNIIKTTVRAVKYQGEPAAMAPAALPAASTISRPDAGGSGRCAGRQDDGWAAAIAVRNSLSRKALAGSAISVPPLLRIALPRARPDILPQRAAARPPASPV